MRFEGTSAYIATDDLKVAVNAAHDVADVNGDGKLGLDDVGAAASKAANAASNAASAVGNTVSGAASKVASWFGW